MYANETCFSELFPLVDGKNIEVKEAGEKIAIKREVKYWYRLL
jgi:hypothetical protein